MVLSYTGEVKLLKKDKLNNVIEAIELHNRGTDNLFKFFINCLFGNLDSSAVPAYIDLRYRYNTLNLDTIAVSSVTTTSGTPIVSSSINEVESGDSLRLAAQFVAAFSKSNFLNPELLQFDGREVYLTITGSDKTIELTELVIDKEKYDSITTLDADQKVEIEWTMYIKNDNGD